MDIFFFQLIIIFVPGLIWERMDSQYGRERPKEQWDVIRRSFVFGLASYGILFVICWLLSFWFGDVGLRLPKIEDGRKTFVDADVFKLVAFASLISIVGSVLWLYVANYKLITRFLQWIGATKRYGDEDLWEFMFNSRRAEVEYVNFRDFDKRLAYTGYVEAFSESEKQRELVLRDVIVYDFDGTVIMQTPRVYIAREAKNIDIEFPYSAPAGQE